MHYHFEGRLTARDCKRHIPHQFVAPANSSQVDISFHFAPYRAGGINNLVTLTVFDPAGFRGAGHRDGDEHMVRINAAEATAGYLPGPLPAGQWTVQVDTHMIMPGEPVHYWMDVTITENAGAAISPTPVAKPGLTGRPRRSPGWFRGDLHSHTYHSDADGRSVAGLVQAARTAGLDFVFLTDHNTTAGLAEMDAAAGEDLLTAGGLELTTFWGHALCLGTRQWVDWRIQPGNGEMAHIAAATYERDQLFIIAHPQSEGDPACTGCNWRFGDMMPGNARLVEIWNGPWDGNSGNEEALSLWYDWLNQGLRLVATAGTDTHGDQDYAAGPGFDVVYADTLSEAAILKAVRAGHLYLSAGPQVSFDAGNESEEIWGIGDTVTQPAIFTVTWAGCPADAQLRLIANGRLLQAIPAGTHGRYGWSMTPDQASWVVVEIRAANGEMLTVTNPIYLQ